MRFRTPFLNPDINRPAFFDGVHEETASFSFACQTCQQDLNVRLLDFLSNANNWFGHLCAQEQLQVSELFGCSFKEFDGHKLVRSHDSGIPYFGIVACNLCGGDHLIYISYLEIQPARYCGRLLGGAAIDH